MFPLTVAQRRLQDDARELAQSTLAGRAAEIDRTEVYPWDNVTALRDAGFLGMTLPTAYGGRGLSYLDAVLVIEQIAGACGVSGRIAVETNMGAVGAVMAYGTEAQKHRAAELVLSGNKPAICITEPGAGSAATEMTTTAVSTDGGYVLNGTKHWITGAGVSRLHLIFARVKDGGEDQGIAGFLVEKDTPGLEIGRREPAMGMRGIPEGEIICRDLFVPDTGLLVPPAGVRRGFAALMTAYNGQRVGAASVALGVATGAYDLAVAHAGQREQFGRPIAEFQGLQWMIADMAIGLNAARAMVYGAAASAPANGFPDRVAAAQAKVLAAETAIKVTNDALQIHGAAGYSRNHPLERMARDARMFTIGGGTSQVLRTQIAEGVMGRRFPQRRPAAAPDYPMAAE